MPIYGWVSANLDKQISAAFGSVAAFEDHYEFDYAHLFGGPPCYNQGVLDAVRQRLGRPIEPAEFLDVPCHDVNDSDGYVGLRAAIRHHQEARGRFVYVQTPGIFEALNGVFGIENHLAWLLLYPEEMKEVYVRQAAWNRQFAMNCLDLGIDMIHVSDDWGSERSLLFSPATWWEMIYPYHKVTTDAVHARGAFVSLHCDGNFSEVIDGVVKLGYAVVHPWQESAGMSLQEFKDRWMDRLTVMGGLDIQTTLGFNNLPRLRSEIERVIRMFADGGLLFCTTHFVQDHCSIEELTFAYDLVRELVSDTKKARNAMRDIPRDGATAGEEGGRVDPRVRTFLAPTRIVWVSDNSDRASVTHAAILLQPKYGQVPEGLFLDGSGCRMENKGAPASVLVDFGRELHGGVQLASGGPSGRDVRVRVRFGESVAEAMAELGERGACNDHAIRDGVIDLPWLGTREIGDSGFRFVRIDLVSEGVLSLESVRAVSLMRPMPQLGSFTCSDGRLNRIWATAARTLHLCCQDYIWDGIKRDRLVWMGDMHPELMALIAVFGPDRVLPDSLDYMRATTPAAKWMNGMPPYTLWWIRCHHDWYRYSGDVPYLHAQHTYLKDVFANLAPHIDKENRCALGGFLDWPTQGNPKAVAAGMQALMLMAFEDGARIAEALNDAALMSLCQSCAARLRQYAPMPEGAKSAAALLALSGLHDARALYEQVLARDGVRGVSTFYGYYMLEAMAMAGDVQHGIDTLREYWGGMLDMGATSFWEDFDVAWMKDAFRIDELPAAGKRDIHGDFGDHCYKGFRHSLCHGWSSGPAAWLIAHVLGIQIARVGCRAVRIKPFLGDLTWAEGSFPTPHGIVRARHERRSDGSIKTCISVPDGVQVE
jgi:hypothetical protein